MKLGKKKGVIRDPRTFQLEKYITDREAILSAPPRLVKWTKGISSWNMFDNDTIGDCTCATIGHMIHAQSAGEVEVQTEDVLKAYSDITGYDGTTETDTGAYTLDVLNYWRKTGVGGHKIHAFAEVPIKRASIHLADWLFGGVYLGLLLPISAQNQIGTEWKYSYEDYEWATYPGSWGGHAVPIEADRYGIETISWGAIQRMSWSFLYEYCDEAYAVISDAWLERRGKEGVPGFDLESLERDLANL